VSVVSNEVPDVALHGDVPLLERMLVNLLENAVHHSPPGGVVSIDVDVARTAVAMRVTDQGAGIAVEDRARIFDRFVQLDNGDRVAPRTGRGLGLTFCRLAVEAHGGRIYVEDGGPGAVFCIRLPRVH
jgi:signal transduction histidine kinase